MKNLSLIIIIVVFCSFSVVAQFDFNNCQNKLIMDSNQKEDLNLIFFKKIHESGYVLKNKNLKTTHIFFLNIDSIYLKKKKFLDSSFICHLNISFISHKKNHIAQTTSLISIGNEYFDGEDGEIYQYKNSEILKSKILLQEFSEESQTDFLFIVYGSNPKYIFGLNKKKIFVFKEESTELKILSITDLVKYHWNDFLSPNHR